MDHTSYPSSSSSSAHPSMNVGNISSTSTKEHDVRKHHSPSSRSRSPSSASRSRSPRHRRSRSPPSRHDDRDSSSHHHSSRSNRRSYSRDRNDRHRRHSRSRSPDSRDRHRRHRDDNRYNSRDRDSSSRHHHHRDRDRDRDRDREDRHHHHKERYTMSKEEAEIMDLTRDARTVFVSQLVARTTEKDLKHYFNQVGHVVQVSMIKDKYSGKCKGFAYVEFEDISEVAHALLLNGQKFCTQHRGCVCSGFPIAIKTSQAEKNYAAIAEHAGGSALSEGIEKRVYLCNLPEGLTEGDLRIVAQVFGNIDKVALLRDRRGRSRGAGYIAFHNIEAASIALVKLHNFTLANQQIKAGKLNPLGQVVAHTGETFPLHEGSENGLNVQARVALLTKLSNMTAETIKNIGGGAILTALTNENTHLQSTSSSSSSTSTIPVVPTTTITQPILPPPVVIPPTLPVSSTVLPNSTVNVSSTTSVSLSSTISTINTPCILLKNMFNPATETEPGWENDIKEEVYDELSKFGKIYDIQIDSVSPDGRVYIYYQHDQPNSPNNGIYAVQLAKQTLEGKKFGGQIIQIEPISVETYKQLFPHI